MQAPVQEFQDLFGCFDPGLHFQDPQGDVPVPALSQPGPILAGGDQGLGARGPGRFRQAVQLLLAEGWWSGKTWKPFRSDPQVLQGGGKDLRPGQAGKGQQGPVAQGRRRLGVAPGIGSDGAPG